MMNQEIVGNLIKSFHLALINLRIYPHTSQMVIVSIDTFFKALNSVVSTGNTLTFSELSGKLLIDGKEAESREIQLMAENLIKLLHQKNIQSIAFRSGINRDELIDFLSSLLRKKKDELQKFPHVDLDQTVYVAIIKGEEAITKITNIIKESSGEIVGLITSLRESFNIIDEIPDTATKELALNKLADELAGQDSSILKDIFERELPPKIEESGLKAKLLGSLSKEKIQEIFGEISVWYEEIRKNESSDFAAIEQLEKLKKFMSTILNAPGAREIPRRFFEDLIQKGMLEHLPDWLSTEPSKPTTVFEVEKLLEKKPSDLLEKNVLENLPKLTDKLCLIENDELIGKLVEKLLENLKTQDHNIRFLASRGISAVYDVLQVHNRENLIRYMELPLIEAMRHETSTEVHLIIIGMLKKRVRQNLLLGKYDLALRILDLFDQHCSDELMPNEIIRFNALTAKQQLVPEIIEILISDLKSGDEAKHLGSLQILSKIGDKAVEPLIRVIKEGDDIRARRLAAQAIKNLGKNALDRFRVELNLGLTKDEIIRVVDALSEMGIHEAIGEINSLLRYPDPAARKELMRFLAKLNTSQSKILIIEQLKDTDPAIMKEAVHLLGELRYLEAAPALSILLNSSGIEPTMQEEICIVLGKIGNPEAIPSLLLKLKKRPSWLTRNRSDIERIRMRAAWSLRKFISTEVKQALELAGKDKTTSVALTAKESLEYILMCESAKQQDQ